MTAKKPKTEAAIVEPTYGSDDLALVEATTRMGASLALKLGVMRPTASEVEALAATALVYARALLAKARG